MILNQFINLNHKIIENKQCMYTKKTGTVF